MAQVALLQTEMNSGFRFVPRIGMNSAAGHTHKHARKKNVSIPLDTLKIEDDGTIMYVLYECVCEIDSEIITNTRFDMREAGLGQVPQ